ncbi:MAG: DUF1192 domain-containing protein [Robiginitomaculum sp.]|nr:DUF1192 domain-containing protein [Robiginitomaculum sp.]
MDDIELRKLGTTFQVGEDLYTVSVDQIKERIDILQAELVRLATALDKKKQGLSSAETFFRNK